MRNFSFNSLYCYLALPAIILTGCIEYPSSQNSLRINFPFKPYTLDPRNSREPYSCAIHFSTHAGLMKLDEEGNLLTDLAQSVIVSNDDRRIYFTIKKAVWSDGSDLTSYDFHNSWLSMLTHPSHLHNASFLNDIENARDIYSDDLDPSTLKVLCPDSKTLIIELNSSARTFLKKTAFSCLFPVHSSSINSYAQNTPSNGPYTILSAGIDEYQLTRSKTFYDAQNVATKDVVVTFIENIELVKELVEDKEIDIGLTFMGYVGENNSISKLVRLKPIASQLFLSMNTNDAKLSNPHLRKAVYYAINCEEAALAVDYTKIQPATTFFHPLLHKAKYLKDTGSTSKKALSSLRIYKESILKDTPPLQLTITYLNHPQQKAIAQIVQDQIQNTLNIKIHLRSYDFVTFIETLRQKKVQLVLVPVIAQFFDITNISERFAKASHEKNYTNWENDSYKMYSDKVQNSYGAKRERHLFQLEEILWNELPCAPLFCMQQTVLAHEEIEEVQMSPIGTLLIHKIRKSHAK